MIKLYGIPGSRAMRPLWMLEELGVPYENVKVSFVNETRTPAFLKLNPNGHIPVLQDGDLTLWERFCDGPPATGTRKFGRHLRKPWPIARLLCIPSQPIRTECRLVLH